MSVGADDDPHSIVHDDTYLTVEHLDMLIESALADETTATNGSQSEARAKRKSIRFSEPEFKGRKWDLPIVYAMDGTQGRRAYLMCVWMVKLVIMQIHLYYLFYYLCEYSLIK